MDEMYGLQATTTVEYSDKALMSPENLILPSDYPSLISSATVGFHDHHHNHRLMFGSDEVHDHHELLSVASAAISEAASITPEFQTSEDVSNLIKAKIASHPTYPRLLQAYIDCQKVKYYYYFN